MIWILWKWQNAKIIPFFYIFLKHVWTQNCPFQNFLYSNIYDFYRCTTIKIDFFLIHSVLGEKKVLKHVFVQQKRKWQGLSEKMFLFIDVFFHMHFLLLFFFNKKSIFHSPEGINSRHIYVQLNWFFILFKKWQIALKLICVPTEKKRKKNDELYPSLEKKNKIIILIHIHRCIG